MGVQWAEAEDPCSGGSQKKLILDGDLGTKGSRSTPPTKCVSKLSCPTPPHPPGRKLDTPTSTKSKPGAANAKGRPSKVVGGWGRDRHFWREAGKERALWLALFRVLIKRLK